MLFWLFADISKDTTINIQDMPVDGIRSLRGKEYSGTTQFIGIQPASCRSLGADEGVERMAATIRLTLTEEQSVG